jgi:predicted amidophosphoribosyltransferase
VAALAGLVDLALPARCEGCGDPGASLCAACRAALGGPARRAWPDPSPPGLPEPWAVATYDGVVRSLVVAHKESGRLAMTGPLGGALARSVTATGAVVGWAQPRPGRSGPLLLVPAPSRPAAVRRRGHDPTLRMARHAAAALRRAGGDVRVLPVLRVGAGVVDQSGLSAAARAANMAGALRVPPRLAAVVAGRRVVVVDDVVTTGATLAAAAGALDRAGAEVVAAAVVAATARRGRRPDVRREVGPSGGLSPGASWV